jgi:glutathione S-transferase
MSLTLYQHPFAAYCWKALIALYERDVPFSSALVEGDRDELAALWPPASLPVLVDGDTVVPESSTAVEYLDRYGDAPPLVPADALWTRVWDRVIDGQVATPMQAIVFDALRPAGEKDPYGVAQARGRLDAAYSILDAHPALAAYFDRLLARPSVARVVDEARPYRELFPLPWPAHAR